MSWWSWVGLWLVLVLGAAGLLAALAWRAVRAGLAVGSALAEAADRLADPTGAQPPAPRGG